MIRTDRAISWASRVGDVLFFRSCTIQVLELCMGISIPRFSYQDQHIFRVLFGSFVPRVALDELDELD